MTSDTHLKSSSSSHSAMPPPPLSLDTGSTPLANQVAGHQNVLSDASGSLVIKPALPREIAFYHLLNGAARSSQLAKLKPFVPQFFGTLRLEGKLDPSGTLTQEGLPVEEVPESVVLENLAHTYTRPSVLDVKLGTVLYAPDASEEKRVRMEKQAKSTTTFETGVRLTGCQTWHEPSSSYILTPKSFGKSITIDQLPSGLVRFFPLPTDSISAIFVPPTPPPSSSSSTTTPASAVQVPHLPLPPCSLSQVAVPPTPISGVSPKEYTQHAISPQTMLRVLDLVDQELGQLEDVLSHLEARFIGSSILLVYEGDAERLENALDRWEVKRARQALLAAERAATGQQADLIDEEEEEDEEDDGEESSSTSSDDDEDDGARADARRARRCPPLTLRMIDFAHTRLVEGEGVDEGVLKGVRTLRDLVQGRVAEVRRAVEVETGVTEVKS